MPRRSNVALVALLLSACGASDGAPLDGGSPEGGSPDAGTGDLVDAADAGGVGEPPPLRAIWDSDSRGLEVWCSLGVGSMSKFAADREQLTPAQLLAAESLRARLAGVDSVCYLDGASCIVHVVAASGRRLQVRGPLDVDCDERFRVITRASFQPLFDLLDCGAVSRSQDAPLKPHAHCDRGLHATGAGDIWVEVPAPGAYLFELVACALPGGPQPPRMRLADEAGAVLLEARTPGDPGASQICQQMTHNFTLPGRFRIQVEGSVGQELSNTSLRFARSAAP